MPDLKDNISVPVYDWRGSIFVQRAFYLNLIYLLFILLGSLFAAALNAPYEREGMVTLPLYQTCALSPVTGEGASAEEYAQEATDILKIREQNAKVAEENDEEEPARSCLEFLDLPATEEDDFAVTDWQQGAFDGQQTLFNIALATAIMNGLLFAWSVLMHWENFGISWHFGAQPLFSVINLGLFAGLIGNLGGIEDLNLALNVDNNIMFEMLNVFSVALAGLIIAALDLIGSNLVIFWACKSYNCWGPEDARWLDFLRWCRKRYL